MKVERRKIDLARGDVPPQPEAAGVARRSARRVRVVFGADEIY
jgi:hypothetical protein